MGARQPYRLRAQSEILPRRPLFINKLIFQIIPEPGQRQIALERGDVDHLPYFALATSSIDPLAKNKDVEIVDSVRRRSAKSSRS